MWLYLKNADGFPELLMQSYLIFFREVVS